jgi:hypothetical protein
MAIQRLSGQTGSVTISGNTFGVTEWKLNRAYNNADVTVTTSGAWEEFCPITRSWSVEISVPFDVNGANIDGAFDVACFALAGADAPVACTFLLKAGKTYSGSGLLENYTVTDSAKDACRVTFNIKGTGVLTKV